MGTWKIVGRMRRSSVARGRLLPLTMLTVSLAVGYVLFGATGNAAAPQTAGRAGTASSMARVSGTVDSATPFKAAQVYLRNVDKQVMYMVFTSAGQFRAVSLFPGSA
jgi:hypothetical protein